MNFSEAANGGVLWKKLFSKISQNSQELGRPATLLKAEQIPTQGIFLSIAKILKSPV